MADALGCDMLTGFGENDLWSYLDSVEFDKEADVHQVDPFEGIDIDLNLSPTDIDLLFWHGSVFESELRDDVMWSSPNSCTGLNVSPRTASPVEDKPPESSVTIKQEIKEEPDDFIEEEDHPPPEEELSCSILEEATIEVPTHRVIKIQKESPRQKIRQQGCSTSSAGTSSSRRRTVVVQKARSILRKVKKDEHVMYIKEEDEDEEEDDEGHVRQSVVPDDQHYAASEAFSRQVASLQHANPYLTAARFDHNYDMKKRIKTDDLGVQTPSDTEREDDEDEEIDVVNVVGSKVSRYQNWIPQSPYTSPRSGSRFHTPPPSRSPSVIYKTRVANSLPTKPSRQLTYELQEEVASSLKSPAPKRLNPSVNGVSNRIVPTTTSNSKSSKRNRHSEDDDDDDDDDFSDTELTKKYLTGRCGNKRRKYNGGNGGSTNSNARPIKRPRYSTGKWETDNERRSLHNNMERMRRVELMLLYQNLRNFVPFPSGVKSCKVNILQYAKTYILRLRHNEKVLIYEKNQLREHQEKLLACVSELRKAMRVKVMGH